MPYDWRPPATGTVTTEPRLAVPAHPPSEPGDLRVAALVDEFVEAASSGSARNRSGRRYRPSALRDLIGILRHHVVRELGDLRVRDVNRQHAQGLVDRLAREGLSVSRIRSVVSAMRALYAYAIERGYADFSPADALTIPRDESGGFQETYSFTETHPTPAPAPPTMPSRRAVQQELEPLALLPERVLSLALKVAVVVFVLLALISLAGSA
jgi:hypothetical protein